MRSLIIQLFIFKISTEIEDPEYPELELAVKGTRNYLSTRTYLAKRRTFSDLNFIANIGRVSFCNTSANIAANRPFKFKPLILDPLTYSFNGCPERFTMPELTHFNNLQGTSLATPIGGD